VRQQIPSDLLARTVLSSRIYHNLVEVAPGLKELAFMARLKQLAEERTQDGGSFDLLVWDAPATGHFLQTLKVSRNFDTYLSGPFSVAGKDLADFFADPGNVTLFPVTTLEEMAVEETIELWQKLSVDLTLRPAAVVCNLASPVLSSSDQEFAEMRDRLENGPDAEPLRYIVDRHAAERELFHKLESSVEGPFRFVRRSSHSGSDLELLAGVSEQLGPALAVNA
jgi:anion-transporting  ArsA/GET3 family ATPase